MISAVTLPPTFQVRDTCRFTPIRTANLEDELDRRERGGRGGIGDDSPHESSLVRV